MASTWSARSAPLCAGHTGRYKFKSIRVFRRCEPRAECGFLACAPWISALAERQEILRAFHRLTQAAEQFLQILVAFHKINFRGIHHEEIRA